LRQPAVGLVLYRRLPREDEVGVEGEQAARGARDARAGRDGRHEHAADPGLLDRCLVREIMRFSTYGLCQERKAAARFVRDRLGRYFLVLPRQIARRSETQATSSREGVVALDPGVRTFQTTYDADGLATEWGKDDRSRSSGSAVWRTSQSGVESRV
jgi:hypothetical protein